MLYSNAINLGNSYSGRLKPTLYYSEATIFEVFYFSILTPFHSEILFNKKAPVFRRFL